MITFVITGKGGKFRMGHLISKLLLQLIKAHLSTVLLRWCSNSVVRISFAARIPTAEIWYTPDRRRMIYQGSHATSIRLRKRSTVSLQWYAMYQCTGGGCKGNFSANLTRVNATETHDEQSNWTIQYRRSSILVTMIHNIQVLYFACVIRKPCFKYLYINASFFFPAVAWLLWF